MAALRAFNDAPDATTKASLRQSMSAAVQAFREASGAWNVHAESWDIPGPGRVVSTHDSEADALTECRQLNQANQSDAGGYTIRPVATE